MCSSDLCLPLADVPVQGADAVIGDRAYGTTPDKVAAIAAAVAEGLGAGGVLPVLKHVPGHGRATADSHLSLPNVTASASELSTHDFVTFRGLNHAPIAMTAHVVYEAIDPRRPATVSPRILHGVVRGEIGFEGLLITDDLSMSALSGALRARAKAAFFAGCDIILHCNGKLDEMREIAAEAKVLSGPALARAEAALGDLHAPIPLDVAAAEARLGEVLGALA